MIIEIEVMNYLRETLDTDKVYTELPDSPKGEFFVVEKTGSSTRNQITTSTLAIQSYAGTLLRAMQLNEQLKEKMRDIAELDTVSGCYLMTDYNFTNTARKYHRYQAVYDITHY